MHFRDIVKISWRSLLANKGRTGLTVLGMVVGIASVIIVYSAGEGIRSLVVNQIQSFGTNIIETEVKVPSTKKGTASDSNSSAAIAQGVQITTLTLDDMEAVAKLPNVKNGYGEVISQEKISYGGDSRKAFLFGVSASYSAIDMSQVATGRFFEDAEDKSLAPVVVLGSKMKTKLFGDSEAIGQYISIRQQKYKVIGVMKARGATIGLDYDDAAFVPIRTLQKKIMGIDHLMVMVHQLIDEKKSAETADEARILLRQRHEITNPDKDDFRVVTMEEMMATLDTITSALTILLLAIVAISLVVGGVGILNVMYVIVSERTPEIGLRKAVGARYNDIMYQFLLEAVLITMLAGVIGIIFGILLSWFVAIGAREAGLDWTFVVPLKAFVVAIFFSLFFGVFFGVYPARTAARLDPIEALRRE
jgi:putative ABC transport system permease protein